MKPRHLPVRVAAAALGFTITLLAGAELLAQQKPAVPAQKPSEAYSPALYQALEWRNIGPFRGGRVTAVAGVPSQPLTFYMGATGGGVWKTDDAGLTWKNVSDGFFKTGSVGAIAVAGSDPNVVYVGMGESPVRGVATSHGDGVYRSTDAGRTWTHVGLDTARQISAVRIHPTNPDLAYVGAQGSPWGPTPDRGVYRTTDGGRTWSRIHHVDQSSGVSALAMDPTNPRVLFAGYWDHQRLPWRVRSGGPGSGVYKTTDGGDTWARLTEGLPKGVMGKIGVAVSASSPDRVWALIEADDGGLYRSDDGGKTWRRVTEDRALRARAWYYTHVIADPVNADTVYVLNGPFLKSIDGGRTFQTMQAPHGDHHALWINPRDNLSMVNGNDGGANVSLNGGRTWSTQANQPTAQFYRVNTDRQFPYHVYGGQQDNTSVAIASRTLGFGIGRPDWFDVGGCESAHVAFNPDDPTLIYAGCYQGIITEYDRRTRQARNVMPYPALGLAEPSDEQKYRFNWNAPIVVSPHDPSVIYHAGNVLFRSDNRGRSWTPISPDLTRNEKDKQGPGGAPITNEGAGGEVYNTIFAVAESPHEAGTIWVGSDDGLVHLTRDGGRSWASVAPKDVGEMQVNAIEVSPHDPATAYLAVTGYKRNDLTPHIFKAADYGKTWTRLVNGIPDSTFVRVVREDPARKGLLYAGTETGVYVSFDDGARWQSLQLNLPVVPVTDLQIRSNDLVASTQGRAFWILDDLTPLHQITGEVARATLHLFKPRDAYRIQAFSGDAPGVGKNPPTGAVMYYSLAEAPKDGAELTLEILDAGGAIIRTFTSAERKPVDAPGAQAPPRLPVKAGMNRFVWDLRHEDITRVPGVFLLGSPAGYRVAPGTYRARLKMGDQVQTQPFNVVTDPRTPIAAGDFARQQDLAAAMYRRVNEIHEAVIRLRDVREQVGRLAERTKDHAGGLAIADAARALTDKVTALEETLVQPKHKTFQDVINFRNQLNDHYLNLMGAVDQSDPPVTQGMDDRFKDLEATWAARKAELDRIVTGEVSAFNALVDKHGVPAVVVR